MELVTAIDKICTALQHAHLETLVTSSSKLMVLITDKQFEYYQPHSEARQIESALYLDVASAMSQHTLQLQTNWVWHIAPYGGNSEDYGSEHLVGAWAWSPKNPVN